VDLDQHRLTSINVFQVIARYPRRIGRNAHIKSHGSSTEDAATILRTDSGATGWGLLAWNTSVIERLLGQPLSDIFNPSGEVIDDATFMRWNAVLRGLTKRIVADAQSLIGRRLSDIFNPDVGVIDDAASPFDFALHDLAGHILGLPVYKLLGGHGFRSVQCYDGAIYLDDLDPEGNPRGVEAVLQNCASDHSIGFRAFKLKIGRGSRWMHAEVGRARDIEVTQAVRATYPDCQILVDANDGYACQDFLAYLEGVADCDLFWIEEPFPEAEDDLIALKSYLNDGGLDTLIADGEGDESEETKLLELARMGLIDVALFDVIWYGLTAWRRIMPTLAELGVRASPHAWGSPLKTLYAAQIAAGLGNVVTVEGVPGLTEGVDTSGYALQEGELSIPDRPGFGISLIDGEDHLV
jgi:D-galactarolactone cycloisomerase